MLLEKCDPRSDLRSDPRSDPTFAVVNQTFVQFILGLVLLFLIDPAFPGKNDMMWSGCVG